MAIVCLDMDGVCCDWLGSVARLFGTCTRDLEAKWTLGDYDINHALGIKSKDLWKAVDGCKGFWENLDPYPWNDELFKLLEPYEVHFCTSPSMDPECFSGKVKWLYKHAPKKIKRNISITTDKWLLAKFNRILIDDKESNCLEWEKNGGKAILFPSIANSNYGMRKKPIEYVKVML